MPSISQVYDIHQADGQAREVVVGVDTHKDVHVAAVVDGCGTALGSESFAATAAGYRALLAWARGCGALRRAGVEGTGSYGSALARYLRRAGLAVIEVSQPDKAERRRGKSDQADAYAAARAVVSGRASAVAKGSDGPVEMLRLFKLAKSSAIKSRTQAINQLKAVLVSAGPALREPLAELGNAALIRRCAQFSAATPRGPRTAATWTLRLLACRITALTAEIGELNQQITALVTSHAPDLLHCQGAGPDTAATLLIAAGDNPSRLSSDAAFAALCGVSPVDASSGKTQRRRLNRGGNRQANSALYTIVLSRLRWDPRTHAYIARRTAEGKTRREAIRCLKRYVAREIYQIITTPPTPATMTPAA